MSEISYMTYCDGLGHDWSEQARDETADRICSNCRCRDNAPEATQICLKSEAGTQLAERDKEIEELQDNLRTALDYGDFTTNKALASEWLTNARRLAQKGSK